MQRIPFGFPCICSGVSKLNSKNILRYLYQLFRHAMQGVHVSKFIVDWGLLSNGVHQHRDGRLGTWHDYFLPSPEQLGRAPPTLSSGTPALSVDMPNIPSGEDQVYHVLRIPSI